jgi:hypothetical protein
MMSDDGKYQPTAAPLSVVGRPGMRDIGSANTKIGVEKRGGRLPAASILIVASMLRMSTAGPVLMAPAPESAESTRGTPALWPEAAFFRATFRRGVRTSSVARPACRP